jgi:hypothetical protein
VIRNLNKVKSKCVGVFVAVRPILQLFHVIDKTCLRQVRFLIDSSDRAGWSHKTHIELSAGCHRWNRYTLLRKQLYLGVQRILDGFD